MSEHQLVWFKRDLRLSDHAPLFEAAKRGPCLCLYVYEPEVIQAEDFDSSHLVFLNESLAELRDALREIGGALVTRLGEAQTVLAQLHEAHRFEALYCHEETGNGITYARDKRVFRWARSVGLRVREFRQFGVIRGLKNRNGWASQWKTMMQSAAVPPPESIRSIPCLESVGILEPKQFGLPPSKRVTPQRGGESVALVTLREFLKRRGAHYPTEMSSPNTADRACSRLSPYLAYGNISMRRTYQLLQMRAAQLRGMPKSGWPKALQSFEKRLHWHCHFIQKLESEPSIEFENMSRACDGLREQEFSQERFEAFAQGQTGVPLVDACMRQLSETGWLNFRMRAMVVSFASYLLWLHWRPTALLLACLFLDYEPGIHFSQIQMQSGTTGMNALRIYSPIKQVRDQDPDGVFIKRWVPELEHVPAEHIAEPQKMSFDAQLRYRCRIGTDYPMPVVDCTRAAVEAKRRFQKLRATPAARKEAKEVFRRHGSRKGPSKARRRAVPAEEGLMQTELFDLEF
ncbi:MAG: FAD-binding domain-containing protein [Myxococcota bacterium]